MFAYSHASTPLVQSERTSLVMLYLTNRFYVAVHLFSNRSQMTSKCGNSAPSCDHFGRHGEWKKYLATKILTKVANWRPTDYKRNLHGKLIDVLVELSKVEAKISLIFLFLAVSLLDTNA